MKRKYHLKAVICLLALSLVLPMALKAQEAEGDAVTQQSGIYSQEELDKLIAPIALYPDTLLSQILMASTYPLEVVEADRWLKQNQSLAGDSLDTALQEKSWDVSVKSLCHFPGVLAMMSDNIDLTNDLGNAFLGQQEQVMNTIQSLRAKAQAQGNLSSTDKQNVASQEGAIMIEPVTPEVIYVPAYDPCWIYGPWWYPECAPLWFWYPGFVADTGFFFGPAIFIGPLDFWCGFRWHRHEIFINVNKTFAVRRPSITRMHGGTESWVHNSVHRRGIAYPNPEIAHRFGQMERPGVSARRAFRGFAPEGGVAGMGISPLARPDIRPPMTTRPDIRPPVTARPDIRPPMIEPPSTGSGSRQFDQPQRGNAFETFGSSGSEVGRQSERGHSSIDGSARGGGGFHGGGSQGDGFHGGGRMR